MIPAFYPDSGHLSTTASIHVLSATKSRVPLLLSARELEAYSYLRPPAAIKIQPGEDEVQAILRLKTSGHYTRGRHQEWESYEESLLVANKQMMRRMLRLDP